MTTTCHRREKAILKKPSVPASALNSFSRAIEIPARLRNRPLGAWQKSARLTALLDRFRIRVLGDLHGRKVVDFAHEKNCGPKTLYELDLLARRARSRNGNGSHIGHRSDYARAQHIHSHSLTATASQAAIGKIQEDAANFAIPEPLWHLSFKELPITRRLANAVRFIGVRSLGDLNGRNAFELLQHKAFGWGMISEIQQLIDRAVSGEFDVGQIEQATAVAKLLRLLEEGLAKLPLRDRQFVLAKIGGQMERGSGPRADRLCLSHAEIGRRCGLTRAGIHKLFVKSMDSLRKIWGPRVPRLLEVIKWRCLSMICPLTPQLLEKWVDSPAHSRSPSKTRGYFARFRLSMEAHVRLIAALDRGIPCWLETNHKLERIDRSVDQFDLALAQMVRKAGGHVRVAEAYRKLSQSTGRNCLPLTIENFLRMLRSVECTAIGFKDPQSPTVRLRVWNGERTCVHVRTNEPSPPGRTRPETIQSFDTKNGFSERRAIASS
jgi:hypothetical protein